MGEAEQKDIVRRCLKGAGIDFDAVDYWQVWDFGSRVKIQLDGDFSLAELRAFCEALEQIEAAKRRATT